MPNWVIRLADPAASDGTVTGSKGASLARIIGARLSVPDGFVVTTDTYGAATSGINDRLGELDDLKSTSERALTRFSREIQRNILDAPFPRGGVSQIRKQWDILGRPAVSIRSSSTAEDLEDASFAGQYDSYLNVRSATEILDKIKRVWASLHSVRAIRYRQRQHLSHRDAQMAVVIQSQLSPTASGVAFSRDPVSGKNQIVVSAAYGLGEGVVSGHAQTDRYVLSPRTGRLTESEIAEKRIRVENSADGGIVSVPVAAAKADIPVLGKRQLGSLVSSAKKLSTLFGSDQDIEFAIVSSRLQILQSRPMTAVSPPVKPETPWNRRIDKKHTWQRRGGPFYRLQQDIAVKHLRHLKDCYDETGSSMSVNHVGHVVNGYLFVRPNPVGERTLKKRHKLQTERVDRSLAKGKSYFEDALQGIIEKHLARLKRMRSKARTLAARVAYMEACIDMQCYIQGNLHWRQGKPGGRPSWHKAFHEITGEPEHKANVYVQAIENRMTMVIARIRELARIAKSDLVLKRIFLDREFETLSTPKVAKRAKAKRFQTRFKAMMRIYGKRAGHGYGTVSGFNTPTWNMDHNIPFEFVATYVEQDLDQLDADEKHARIERDRAAAAMRRRLANQPDKLAQFNQALKEAVIGVRFLEDHNYYMEQCSIGTMREAIHWVGQGFVERGSIDEPDDVFHFSIEELKQLARQRKPSDLREDVLSRTEERDRRGRMAAPSSIGKKPKKSKANGESDQKPPGLDGNIIRGSSASSGHVTGKAVVATRGGDHPRVHPGDILVAENVGPDWTPLFATIGGLVLDSGSLSQHAALVAREYKIPSVMQTKEASKVIQDGQRITIDGDAGIVELTSA